MRFIPYSVQVRIVALSVPDALEVSTLAWVVARGILNPSTPRRGTSTLCIEPSAGHEGDLQGTESHDRPIRLVVF